MIRSIARAVAVASAVATAAVAPGVAGATSPRLLTGYGKWTFAQLGYGAFQLHPRPVESEVFGAVRYRLPPRAKEGGRHWYVGRLHYVLTMRPDSPPGVVYVSASANRWPWAQIRYVFKRPNGRPVLSSDALGLVEGQELRTASSPQSEIHFENYFPYGGVRGGLNTITFMVEQYEGARVESLTILPDSGLEISPFPPGRAQLVASTPTRPVRVGDSLRIRYRLRNVGGRAANDARVVVRAAPAAFDVDGERARTYAAVAGGREVTGSFELAARAAGRHAIALDARAGPSRPRAVVYVRVLPKRGGGRTRWWPALLVVPVLGGLALAGAQRVRR